MKRILMNQYGGPEVLQLTDSDIPEPHPGEVRVKILSAGVSYPDILVREGLYPGIPPLPFTPGYDIVGTVDKPGSRVSSAETGQMVAAMTTIGGYAEYLCVPEAHLVPVPDDLDPAEAVCLVLNYLTAYQALKRSVQHFKPGQRMLLHGAGGGIGTALLQLGQLEGLEMYGTASAAKHALIRELGGVPIDYRYENFVTRLQELTQGEGVDIVIDHFIGTHFWRSYRTLRRGGTLVFLGTTNIVGKQRFTAIMLGIWTALLFLLMKLLPDGRRVTFCGVPRIRDKHPDWHREDMLALFQFLREGKIQPVIAERMPLEEAPRAHELLGNAAIGGRIVLVIG
jgi:NADPH2:quinone reductase